MLHPNNPRSAQTAEPKPRDKKCNRDSVNVVRETARTGDEDFTYFVVNGKLRSTK